MPSYEVDIKGYPARPWKVFSASEAGALVTISPLFKLPHREITLRYQDPETGIRWTMTYGFRLIGGTIRPHRRIVHRLMAGHQPMAVPPPAAS